MAKTDTSYSATSAAATSSCVECGLDAQRTTSAPPACRVRIRFAVSVVTCRQAEMRWPASGCSRSNRSRIAASTGICRSAHSIRRVTDVGRNHRLELNSVVSRLACPDARGRLAHMEGAAGCDLLLRGTSQRLQLALLHVAARANEIEQRPELGHLERILVGLDLD